MPELIDVRTVLASSRNARVEVGRDGILHLLAGPVTIHLERSVCEELADTLSRAISALKRQPPERPVLRLVHRASAAPEIPEDANAATPEVKTGDER